MSTIEELRLSLGYTQEKMANILGISTKTLSKYENDSTNLPTILLKKYIDIFGVSFDNIFLGKKYEIIVQRRKAISRGTH